MLQLMNSTPFAAGFMPLPDADGVDTIFTVVKGTFRLGPTLRLADEQVPVVLVDEYYSDPTSSSIRRPSDVCLGKRGCDILLVGSAWSPNEQPTWHMDVSLTVGSVAKAVRVFGDRVWGAGGTIDWVSPFTSMPLVWERAYGGTDRTSSGQAADRRNPVGRGFRASGGDREAVDLRLPNLEDPSQLLSSHKDRPQPACFAPVAPSWLPRAAFAGTYDEAWQANRAPFLPNDFDARFFQLAPPGLTYPGYLRGGEMVNLLGAAPAGQVEFVVPSIDVRVVHRFDSGEESREAVLDTMILEPDEGRVILAWRTQLSCDKRALKLKEIEPIVIAPLLGRI